MHVFKLDTEKGERMDEITSRENQWIKLACSLKQKKGRLLQQRIFVEGMRVVSDAADNEIYDALCFISPRGQQHERFPTLYEKGLSLGWTFYAVTDSVYDKLKDTKSPQGIAAVLPFFSQTLVSLPVLAPQKPVVYLQAVQDPGNAGTVLRTAAAAGAAAVFFGEDSVDVYNDKTIRSAMGAIFKVPIVQNVTAREVLDFCHASGRRLAGTAPQGTVVYAAADYTCPVVLAFGNEGNGLSTGFLDMCDDILTIPMHRNTESLNLSMSVGIVLYKAWEINGFKE